MRKGFKADTPELILIVTDSRKDSPLEKIFQKGLDQIERPHVALSLYIAPGDLKNMLTAIRLMDVRGIFIDGKYRKKGRVFADVLKDGPTVNTVVLKKKRYYGYNTTLKRGRDPESIADMVSASIMIWTGRAVDKKLLAGQIRRIRRQTPRLSRGIIAP